MLPNIVDDELQLDAVPFLSTGQTKFCKILYCQDELQAVYQSKNPSTELLFLVKNSPSFMQTQLFKFYILLSLPNV